MDFLDLEYSRVLLAFIVGYFMCLSGSFTQITTANPLASPSTLGMSALAVIAVLLSYFLTSIYSIEVSHEILSFFIGLLFVLVGVLKSNKKFKKSIWEHFSISQVVLMGLAFNLFVGALFSIIQFVFIAFHLEFPTSIWFGSLKQYSSTSLYLFIFLWGLISFYSYKIAGLYSLLNLGGEFALGFDQKIHKYQKRGLLLSLLMTISVVSFFGVFSFMGLVFPHLLRQLKWFESNIMNELRYGPWICGLFFIILDQICFLFPMWGAEIPVGMLSGLVGTFFLLMRLFKSKQVAV